MMDILKSNVDIKEDIPHYFFQVYLLDSLLKVHGELSGGQSGEHFGASLTVTDINGDDQDDIIIGAPLHTDYDDPELKYEIGAVYIYHQLIMFGNSKSKMKKELTLRGKVVGGRFGSAVAALGDTNLDGFKDVAVGAPYENSGVVYIYHGSESGLKKRPNQIIRGDQFNPALSLFGSSFSGAVDIDDNKYTDLIVGAYGSDVVVFFPARPVVRLKGELNFSPQHITFENKTCEIKTPGVSVTRVPCANMQYCVNYHGDGVTNSIIVNVSISLDVKNQQNRRHFFLDTKQFTTSHIITLAYGQNQCQKRLTYIRPDTRDKISPMEAEMTIALVEESWPASPIQEAASITSVTQSLTINKNCKNNLICIPDLQLRTNM